MSGAVSEGLCGRCEHRRDVVGARGTRYVLCALSRRDDDFARYPRLPMRSCPGFSPLTDEGEESGADGQTGATS